MAKKNNGLITGMRQKTKNSIEYRFTYEGKRYEVSGKTPEECILKADKKKQEIDSGIYKKAKKLTVAEYFERWIEAKRDTVKETTLRTDSILLNRISQTVIDKAGTKFGELKLAKVEVQNVRDLQKALQKSITMRDKNGENTKRPGLTTRSTNDSIRLLKQVYKSAITERITPWNPVDGVKPVMRKEEQARDTIHRALTIEETAVFLETAKQMGSWYCPLYEFLLNTGCRLGEAGALRNGDIIRGQIRISRTITRTEVGGYIVGEDTKTAAGKRVIPMNDGARQALADQKKRNAIASGDHVVGMDDMIFRSPRGSLLKSANVNADVAKICDVANIDRFAVHAFRDTFATRCVESNMPVKTLQEIMGHTDIKMTLGLYTHVMDDQKQEQLMAVNFM